MRYVGEFYGHRFWATPGAFTRGGRRLHAEPFADAERSARVVGQLRERAGHAAAVASRRASSSAAPSRRSRSTAPTTTSSGRDFPERCEVAFPDLVGPFVVPRAGHFLQWERAELFNRAVVAFLRDRL